MSKKTTSQPQDQELDDEALRNLTGFFDVLIQMDLEQKAKQQADTKPPTERANGLTGKDNNLVPISIITGTRTKRGYK
jgi:hypothetical protein